jgi:hypothetical protein
LLAEATYEQVVEASRRLRLAAEQLAAGGGAGKRMPHAQLGYAWISSGELFQAGSVFADVIQQARPAQNPHA